LHSLTSMLKYRRQQFSDSQKEFCVRFLHPVFGKPDKAGNYIKIIGDKPKVCFASHHDTVHREDGMQKIEIVNDVISLAPNSGSSCLGADCTTGIWLQLEMIEAGIEGVYVCHSSEEIGCVGSKALIDRSPKWLRHVEAVISFDRKGDSEIITHQMGYRTASDAFAHSLADALGLPLQPSPNGSYTDSNEYRYRVSECTNLAVGYYAQHTKNETQDLKYLLKLRDALITADFSNLVFERDPNAVEMDHWGDWGADYGYPFHGGYDVNPYRYDSEEDETMVEAVCIDGFPELVDMMVDWFGTPEALIDELSRYGYRPDVNKLLGGKQ